MTVTTNSPFRKGTPRPSDRLDRIASSASPHAMYDPFDIGEALSRLCQLGEALTIYPSGLADALLARVDSVDPEQPHFILDLANDATLAPGRATFVAALPGNAKIQFDLEQDFKTLPGLPHLVEATFPESCLVLNRRAAPRLDTPISGHYSASFSLLNRQFELPLCDYSVGGVGMRATPDQALELYVGRKLRRVRLQIGPALEVVADLEIRLLRPYRSFLLGEQVQIGCSFAHIDMEMHQDLQQALRSKQA